MASLVGLAFILRETPAHPSVSHALYQGLHRQLWALAVTWIILACEEGYGGKPRTKSKSQWKTIYILILTKYSEFCHYL